MNLLRRSSERVIPLEIGLQLDTGAPLPHLLQSEQRTFLAFYLRGTAPWTGMTVEMVDASSSVVYPIGVIEWLWCGGAVLGSPNDEVFHGHRLWKHGLSDVGAYSAGEVLGSRWIAEVERVNKVHRNYDPDRRSTTRHFIVGFHDSTFECLAEGFTTWATMASMPDVLLALTRVLDTRDVPVFPSTRVGEV